LSENSGLETKWARLRENMVRSQIEARGIRDPRVLGAMRKVPRHRFVDAASLEQAYEDRPLPIGLDQTISQPYIVAFMTEQLQLRGGERVLEVGTGSGYQTAVLAEMGGEVFTLEIHEPLSRIARQRLAELGYGNVRFAVGDGRAGWPEEAPFGAILAAASAEAVPPALLEQLAIGGRLVLPLGVEHQDLMMITRTAEGDVARNLLPVRFVPLVHG
jgi:protein-L-isoaspartate(D-aspartate) O-methyltransferase